MKNILVLFAIVFISIPGFAQKYNTVAGVRIGARFGLTVQQRVLKNTTIEGIFQTNIGGQDDIMLTFLWEQHQKLIGKNLNFYYGGGFHKGWMVNRAAELELKDPSGISLIAGVEITLDRLNISLDYKPVLNVISGERFFESHSALSVRYVLIKSKKKKKKRWKLFNN